MITGALEAVHTAALASWFGCMCYSVMFVLLFLYVSWHKWPLRIFALPEKPPPIDRKFMNASQGLVLTLGGALALGVVAGHV